MKSATMALLALLMSTTLALAVPTQVNYQGYLTNPEGAPLDTTVSMTFLCYTVPYQVLWQETHPAVTVTDGYFNVILGSVTALSDSVFASGYTPLQVTIGSDNPLWPATDCSTAPYAFRTGTVDGATGGKLNSSLSVGLGNTIPQYDCFAAGNGHVITTNQSTIAGGSTNSIGGVYGFIGAGVENEVNSAGGVCVGGYQNSVTSFGAANTIGGGYLNEIPGFLSYITIGGGAHNIASGSSATVAGGMNNRARGNFSVVSGGGGEEPADSNSAIGNYATIGGGSQNLATGTNSVVSGGMNNRARGNYSVVSGGGGLFDADSNSASGANSFIGAGKRNWATGNYAFVGSGYGCQAIGEMSVIGGGEYNYSSGERATIAGGWQNQATAQEAAVGGGNGNIASGVVSTVPGGAGNEATAFASTAMGFRANANHIGSFVWADRTYQDFASSADNEFSLRASGGVRIATNTAGTVGVKLDNGDTAWEVLSDSTKKANRKAVNTAAILDRVVQLPIEEWNYTHQDASNTHIGPMAQTFHKLFGYGDDNNTISTIDPDGVALAAIQELAKQNREMQNEIITLRSQIQSLIAGQAKTSMEINHEVSK